MQVRQHSPRRSPDAASFLGHCPLAHRIGEHDERGFAAQSTGGREQTVEAGGTR
jgi:hypothetical protein